MPWWRNFLFEGALKALLASCLLSTGVWVTYKGRHNLREAKGKEAGPAVYTQHVFAQLKV